MWRDSAGSATTVMCSFSPWQPSPHDQSARGHVRVLLTVATGVAVLVGLVLHAYLTGLGSVAADEFAKAIVAVRGLHQPSLWFDGTWMPSHYFLIALGYLLTGNLLVATRLISVCFGVLLIVSLWRVVRQADGEIGAAIALFLAATHSLVVLLSATGMADIAYVSLLVCGAGLYVRSTTHLHSRRMFLASCTALTLACAFHYNAWIAVVAFVPFVLFDLQAARHSGKAVVAGLLILGSVPAIWIVWNWFSLGDPTAFLAAHREYSAQRWTTWGWQASFPAAARVIVFQYAATYAPLLSALLVPALALFVGRRGEGIRHVAFLWSVLAWFTAVLLVLYARGGRPTAFDARYFLLPSVLMIAIVSACLGRLWSLGPGEVRVFVAGIAVSGVLMNVYVTRDLVHAHSLPGTIVEARDLSGALAPYIGKSGDPRLLLEIKYWNSDALRVYLNRVDAVVDDRNPDPAKNPVSRLLGSRASILAELDAMNIGFIAVWSTECKDRMRAWNLVHLVTVGDYDVFDVRRAGESLVPNLGLEGSRANRR